MECYILFCRWATHWFKLTLEIPSDWIGKEVHLVWDSGTEAMVNTLDIYLGLIMGYWATR